MGSMGASSITETADAANPFRTEEGWNEYYRRLRLLHNYPTVGQERGIMLEVQEWEKIRNIGLEQEQEYHDIMRAQELYEKLIGKEGGK